MRRKKTIEQPEGTGVRFGLHNTVEFVHRDAQGNVLMREVVHNQVQNQGYDWLAGLMGSAAGVPAKYIGLSSDTIPAASATIQTNLLDNTLARVDSSASYSHTASETHYHISHQFTSDETVTVQSAGLYTTDNTSSLQMCANLSSSASLVASDTLTVTWTVTLA